MSSMAIAAPLTVGFSQVGSESGWRAAETSVAKEEAAKRGITLKIADGQQKQENQIKAVRSFIAQGGRRDLHCAGGGHRLGTGAERGRKRPRSRFSSSTVPLMLKIKISTLTTVTANNVLEGQLIGDWLVKTVDGKPCNVVGTAGAPLGPAWPSIVRKASPTRLPKRRISKLSAPSPGDFTRSKGKEVMESFIKAENNGKNICMVFAPNDDMAIGAIRSH